MPFLAREYCSLCWGGALSMRAKGTTSQHIRLQPFGKICLGRCSTKLSIRQPPVETVKIGQLQPILRRISGFLDSAAELALSLIVPFFLGGDLCQDRMRLDRK